MKSLLKSIMVFALICGVSSVWAAPAKWVWIGADTENPTKWESASNWKWVEADGTKSETQPTEGNYPCKSGGTNPYMPIEIHGSDGAAFTVVSQSSTNLDGWDLNLSLSYANVTIGKFAKVHGNSSQGKIKLRDASTLTMAHPTDQFEMNYIDIGDGCKLTMTGVGDGDPAEYVALPWILNRSGEFKMDGWTRTSKNEATMTFDLDLNLDVIATKRVVRKRVLGTWTGSTNTMNVESFTVNNGASTNDTLGTGDLTVGAETTLPVGTYRVCRDPDYRDEVDDTITGAYVVYYVDNDAESAVTYEGTVAGVVESEPVTVTVTERSASNVTFSDKLSFNNFSGTPYSGSDLFVTSTETSNAISASTNPIYFTPNYRNSWTATLGVTESMTLGSMVFYARLFTSTGSAQAAGSRNITLTVTKVGDTTPLGTVTVNSVSCDSDVPFKLSFDTLVSFDTTTQFTVAMSNSTTSNTFIALSKIELGLPPKNTDDMASPAGWSAVVGDMQNAELFAKGAAAVVVDGIKTITSLTVNEGEAGASLTFAGLPLTSATTTINADTDVSGIVANLGAVTVAAGKTLTVGADTTLSSVNLSAGGILRVIENVTLPTGGTYAGGIVKVAEGTTVTMSSTSDWSVGQFVGEGTGATLTKSGTGTMTFTTATDKTCFADNMTVNVEAGMLKLATSNAGGDAELNNSTLAFTGEGTFESSGFVKVTGDAGLTIDVAVDKILELTGTGVLSSAGGTVPLKKTGEGTFKVALLGGSQDTAYAGAVTIEEGMLELKPRVNAGKNYPSRISGAISGAGTLKVSASPILTGAMGTFTGTLLIVDGGKLDLFGATLSSELSITVEAGGAVRLTEAQQTALGDKLTNSGTVLTATNQAFGVTNGFSYVFTGITDANYAELTNWACYNGASLPGVPGADDATYYPILLDGDQMFIAADPTTKYKEVLYNGTNNTLEGWNLCLGVTNGVHFKLKNLYKLENGDGAIYVDEESKLTIETLASYAKKLNFGHFHIASEKGLVVSNDVTAGLTESNNDGATLNYYLDKKGSVTYAGLTTKSRTHTVSSLTLDLGTKSPQRMKKTRKLIGFTSQKDQTFEVTASGVSTTVEDDTAAAVDVVTVGQDVGSYKVRTEDDGFYIDYVAYGNITEVAADETVTMNAGGEAGVTVAEGGTLQIVLTEEQLANTYIPAAGFVNNGTLVYGTLDTTGAFVPAEGSVTDAGWYLPSGGSVVRDFSDPVTFSNKSEDGASIAVNGLLSGTIDATKLTLTAGGTPLFATSGDVAGSTAPVYFTPNVDIGAGGTWTATFTVAEASTLTKLTLTARTFNSSGGANGDKLVTFTATFPAASDETDAPTKTNSLAVGGSDTLVELSPDQAISFQAGDTFTIKCEENNEPNATYIALAKLDLAAERTGATWSALAGSATDVTLKVSGAAALNVAEAAEVTTLTLTAGSEADNLLVVSGEALTAGTVKVGAGVTLMVGAKTLITELDLSAGGKIAFEGETIAVETLTLGTNRDWAVVATDAAKLSVTTQVNLTEGLVENDMIPVTWTMEDTVEVTVTDLNGMTRSSKDTDPKVTIVTTTDGTREISYPTTLSGKGAWYEFLFEDTQANTGNTSDAAYVMTPYTTISNTQTVSYESVGTTGRRAVALESRPWIAEGEITYPAESTWTATFYAKLPSKKGGVVIGFGGTHNTEKGLFALVRGTVTNEVLLVSIPPANKSDAFTPLARMVVPNAESMYHLYTFVVRRGKTNDTVEIYLDETPWLTYRVSGRLTTGGGLQIGNLLNGGVEETNVQNKSRFTYEDLTLGAVEAVDGGAVDMLRVYNAELSLREVPRIVEEGYDYTSPGTVYTRTFATDDLTDDATHTANWVATDAWETTAEQKTHPSEGALVTLTANTIDAVIAMNQTYTVPAENATEEEKAAVVTAQTVETLTLTGEKAITLCAPASVPEGQALVHLTVMGLTTVDTNATVECREVTLEGPVDVAKDKTLTLTLTNEVLTKWGNDYFMNGTSIKKVLTGCLIGEGDVCIRVVDEGWTPGEDVDTITGAGTYSKTGWELTIAKNEDTNGWMANLVRLPWEATIAADGTVTWAPTTPTGNGYYFMQNAPVTITANNEAPVTVYLNGPATTVVVKGTGDVTLAPPTAEMIAQYEPVYETMTLKDIVVEGTASLTLLGATGAEEETITSATVAAGATLTTSYKVNTATLADKTATFEMIGESTMTGSDLPTNLLAQAGNFIFDRPVALGTSGLSVGHGQSGNSRIDQTITFKKNITADRFYTVSGNSVHTEITHVAGEVVITGAGTTGTGADSSIIFGYWHTGDSVYNLTNGALRATNGGLRLGHDSSASMTVSGGTLQVKGINGSARQTTSLALSGTGRLELGTDGYPVLNNHTFTMADTSVLNAYEDATVLMAITLSDTPVFSANEGKTLTIAGTLSGTGTVTIGETGKTGTVDLRQVTSTLPAVTVTPTGTVVLTLAQAKALAQAHETTLSGSGTVKVALTAEEQEERQEVLLTGLTVVFVDSTTLVAFPVVPGQSGIYEPTEIIDISSPVVHLTFADTTAGNLFKDTGTLALNLGTPTGFTKATIETPSVASLPAVQKTTGNAASIVLPDTEILKESTIAFWGQIDNAGAVFQDIFRVEWASSDGTNSTKSLQWQWASSGNSGSTGNLSYYYATNTNIFTALKYTAGTRHHWVLVTDVADNGEITLKMYVDGVPVARTSNTYDLSTATRLSTIYLGGASGRNNLAAHYADVRVYGKALSPAEVTELYNLIATDANVWTIASGSTSGTWNDVARWSQKTLPTAEDTAYVDFGDGTTTLELPEGAAGTARTLLLNGVRSGTLALSGEGTLTATTTRVAGHVDITALSAASSLGAITIGAGKTLTVKDAPANLTFADATSTLEWKDDTPMTTLPTTILATNASMIFNREVSASGSALAFGTSDAGRTQTATFLKDMSLSKLETVKGNTGVTTIHHNAGNITLSGSNNGSNTSATIIMGHWRNGSSTYNLNGGSLRAVRGGLRLGHHSPATLNIAGGTLQVTDIQGEAAQTTTLVLSSGRLELGDGGYADFNNHTFTMSGGTLFAYGDATVSPAIALSGTPTFAADEGKTLTLAGTMTFAEGTVLTIGETGKTGTVKMSGALANVTLKGNGTLGGTLTFGSNTQIDASESILTLADGTVLNGTVTIQVPAETTATSGTLVLKGTSEALPKGATLTGVDGADALMVRYDADGAEGAGYYVVRAVTLSEEASAKLPADLSPTVTQAILNAAVAVPGVTTITDIVTGSAASETITNQAVDAIDYFENILSVDQRLDSQTEAIATVKYDFGFERMTMKEIAGEVYLVFQVGVQGALMGAPATFKDTTSLELLCGTQRMTKAVIYDADPTGTMPRLQDALNATRWITVPYKEFPDIDTYTMTARAKANPITVYSSTNVDHTPQELPTNTSLSFYVELDITDTRDRPLIVLNDDDNASGNNKAITLAIKDGNLMLTVNGNADGVDTLTLFNGVQKELYKVAFALTIGTDGNMSKVEAKVVGSSLQTGAALTLSGSNFSHWEPLDGDVKTMEVHVGEAWSEATMNGKLTYTYEETPEVAITDTVAYTPEMDGATVTFAEDGTSTLSIPAEATPATLSVANASSGTIAVAESAALAGEDTGEPGVPAYNLSPDVTVTLAAGSTLQMDGRLTSPVVITGTGVTLGAETPDGVLILDAVDFGKYSVTVTQGTVEVYNATNLPDGELPEGLTIWSTTQE